MAKKTNVTPAQAMEVRQLANDKGVTRWQFQQLLNDGSFARELDRARQLEES